MARPGKRPRHRLARRAVIGLALLLAGFVLYQGWFLAHVFYWVRHNPQTTSIMQLRLHALRARDPGVRLRHRWVNYRRISIQLKRAIIAAEDARFVEHHGFDWAGIEHAMTENQRRGRVVAGGSTITQQLAKNLFLSGERTMLRKVQEAIITVMLEAVMTKRRIFEIYLNVVEWGNGVFGAEAAARHYFGVSAARLGPDEAARLAAMLPRPRYYDRHRDSAYLARYAGIIRQRMPSAHVP